MAPEQPAKTPAVPTPATAAPLAHMTARPRFSGRARAFAPWAGVGLLLTGVAFGLGMRPAKSVAQDATQGPHGRLVIALGTGRGDPRIVGCALRAARQAKQSGYLEEVDLLVYEQGADALAANATMRSTKLTEMAREAQAAGVYLMVAQDSLEECQLNQNVLDPRPDRVVTQGAVELAQLASLGYTIIRY